MIKNRGPISILVSGILGNLNGIFWTIIANCRLWLWETTTRHRNHLFWNRWIVKRLQQHFGHFTKSKQKPKVLTYSLFPGNKTHGYDV